MNSAVKMIEKKLLLLDPSLATTPKQQARVYGTGPSHSPVQDVKKIAHLLTKKTMIVYINCVTIMSYSINLELR